VLEIWCKLLIRRSLTMPLARFNMRTDGSLNNS